MSFYSGVLLFPFTRALRRRVMLGNSGSFNQTDVLPQTHRRKLKPIGPAQCARVDKAALKILFFTQRLK